YSLAPGVTIGLRRHDAGRCVYVVIEDRREPLFRFAHAPAFSSGIIFNLITLDLADAEISALRVAEIESTNRRTGPHGEALGQFHANALALQQPEQRALLGVIGLRRIAGRWADAAIRFGDQLLVAEHLIAGITPKFLAHALVQMLGKRLGEAVGQCLHHDGGVVVVGAFETLGNLVLTDSRGNGEAADIVGKTALARRNEIAQRGIGTALALGQLLAQRMQRRDRLAARLIGINVDVIAL